MRKILVLLFILLLFIVPRVPAPPAYSSFNTNQFGNDGANIWITNGTSATNIVYVTKSGSDTTGVPNNQSFPYLTIKAANNAVLANYGGTRTNWTIKLVGGGTWNEGLNPTLLTNNTTIVGDSRYTTVYQSQVLATVSPCIGVNTGCHIKGIFIQANGFYTNAEQLPVGAWDAASSGYAYSGIATVEDCAIFGDSDGPTIINQNSNPTNMLRVIDSDVLFDYDAGVVQGNNATLLYDGCIIQCVGTNAQATGTLRGICNNGASGTLIVKNCIIRNRFTTNATASIITGINITTAGCTNIIDNNIFDVFYNGPASSSYCDIAVHSGATTTCFLSNNKRWDGTPLQVVKLGSGAKPNIAYPQLIDAAQVGNMTNGGNLNVPSSIAFVSNIVVGNITNTNSFTVISPTIVDAGTWTNIYGRPVLLSIPYFLTTAGVSGRAAYAFAINGLITSGTLIPSISTTSLSVGQTYTNIAQVLVQPNQTLVTTNQSIGAGDTAGLVAGTTGIVQ